MEEIKIVIFFVSIIVGVIALISYYGNKKEMNNEHKHVTGDLKPVRTMEDEEIDHFNEFYKTKIIDPQQVFNIKGSVGYVMLKVNHSGEKEFNIGGVKVSRRSVLRLKKKDVNIDIDDYVMKDYEIKILEKQLKKEKITEEKFDQEIEKIENKYLNVKAEFVLVKDKAYLLKLNEWQLS